ncbi:MAG: adenylate/guanylate cyclase domain-containing protein [Burkholderiales bacterium]
MPRPHAQRAVLFADICGSTRLYQRLGDALAKRVVGEALSLLGGALSQYQGRLVKTIGDCALCMFPDADCAVLAASRMQSMFADGRPGGEAIRIHVGIHFGSVIEDDGDVFGATVNIAAYLAAVASPEQILIAEKMQAALSPPLKLCVRPLFNALLKGAVSSTTVYQVLWKPEDAEVTSINLSAERLLPSDLGSLRVAFGKQSFVVDRFRPVLAIGRGPGSDLVVKDMFASRQHASICVRHTNFCLVDQSINGTFVKVDDGAEVHVLREEFPLAGTGRISLGRSFGEAPSEVIEFSRDRRSMFRI